MTSEFRYQGLFRAELENHGMRLDRFVQDAIQSSDHALSRSKIAELIDLGFVTLNGKTSKTAAKIKSGDLIQISIPHVEETSILAYDFPIRIHYEDEDCLVIHKPAGLVVHPSAGHAQDTLVNALIEKVKDLKIGFTERRPGIVHRLDKDTSGILVVAKNDHALENLSKQFKDRTVHRLYHALVYGTLSRPVGRIETLLARHPNHRKKFRSAAEGKRAVTHFQVKDTSRGISLVQCKLETGRTHQIRVHLSEQGCPIVADPIYSHSKRIKALSKEIGNEILELKGIGLHATELAFKHPRTGDLLKFSEPWPENLRALVEKLGWTDV